MVKQYQKKLIQLRGSTFNPLFDIFYCFDLEELHEV